MKSKRRIHTSFSGAGYALYKYSPLAKQAQLGSAYARVFGKLMVNEKTPTREDQCIINNPTTRS
jgi:hypothetical protein